MRLSRSCFWFVLSFCSFFLMTVYVMGSNTYTNHAALRCAPISTEAVESSIYVLCILHGSSTLSPTSLSVMAKEVPKEFAVACMGRESGHTCSLMADYASEGPCTGDAPACTRI